MAYAKYLEKYSTTLRVGVSADRGRSITASGEVRQMKLEITNGWGRRNSISKDLEIDRWWNWFSVGYGWTRVAEPGEA